MTTEKQQAGAVVPAQSSVPIGPVAAVYKRRAESAEALNVILAHQQEQAMTQMAALRDEIARLKGQIEEAEDNARVDAELREMDKD